MGDWETKLVSGRKLTIPAGTYNFMITSSANLDPTVFSEPSKFWPARPEAGRMLTYNAELPDIRACGNTTGCPSAPRPCPGAWLSMRVAKKAVTFFTSSKEQEKTEL